MPGKLTIHKTLCSSFRLRQEALCFKSPKSILAIACFGLFLVGQFSFGSWIPDSKPPLVSRSITSDGSDSDIIAILIEQLDSDKFEERESAAIKLIEQGEEAIGPLAFKTFNCSPETCWRIRKTLEQICVTGSEKVFYKTTGILQLRFDSGTIEMQQRLDLLKTKWKTQRKKEAIARLRTLGAKIEDPMEGVADNRAANAAQQLFLGGGMAGNVVIVNGQVVELSPNSGTASVARTSRKKLTQSQQKTEIKKILESDLRSARKIVLGSADKKESKPQNDQEVKIRQLMLQQAMFAPGIQTQGVTVELGGKWKGNAKELEDLSEVSNLTLVKLSNIKFDRNTVRVISNLSAMTKLVLEECQIDAKAIKNSKWTDSLSEIELSKLKITTGLIDSLRSLPKVQTMTFSDCDFKGAGFESLKKLDMLRGLQLKDSKIPKEFFKVIESLPRLTYLNFATCQFKTADYQELKRKRSNLQVSYTAQAFLGVQGPMNLTGASSDSPCVVSEVIPGSGAEKGGLKPNDLIQAVNGEKVGLFEDLRLQIAQHYPGDTLSLDVTRNNKKIKLKVVLTGRMVD